MPDGTSRFSYKGKPIFHYMGCSTFSNFTVLPEIAVAKIREDAPFDKSCYIGCGVTTGVGAVVNTAKVDAGRQRRRVRPRRHRAQRHPGREDGRRRQDRRRRHQRSKEEWGRQFGMTDFVNPTKVRRHRPASGRADRRRRRLHLRLHRQHQGDAAGARSCHRGWGVSVIIGVAEAGKEIATRPFQLVTGRVWNGTAFGGARGRTDVPKIVDWYMNGKIEIDPMITHVLKLEEINKGFDLMHEGKSIRSVVVF